MPLVKATVFQQHLQNTQRRTDEARDLKGIWVFNRDFWLCALGKWSAILGIPLLALCKGIAENRLTTEKKL